MTHALEPSPYASSETTTAHEWHWRLEDSSGAPVTSGEGSPRFPSQSDAETWVGEVWRDLADDGVDQVTLFEGDRLVYGPMSLHAAQ